MSLCLVSVVSVCYVVAIIFGVFSVSPIAHPLMRKKERKNGNLQDINFHVDFVAVLLYETKTQLCHKPHPAD